MKHLILAIATGFLIQTTVAQNTDSAKVYYQKGIVEKDSKHYQSASKYFDKAIDFDKKYKDAYSQNGLVNLEMRKTDAAKGNFTKLYELDSENKIAIEQLMQLYYNYNQYAKAIEFANKCAGCENAERIISMSSFKLEDYTTALKGLQNIIAKNPNDAEATYTIGKSYLDMEQYTKAVPYYIKATELDSSKNNWMYEMGLLYYTLDNYKDAKLYFLKAAQSGYLQSNDFNENLGYAYIFSGEFDKGEKLLLDILAKKPGNTDILRDIAEAYYKQKMYDKSLGYCQKLIDLDANDAKALYQAGLCFQKKGDNTKGQAMCDKAIKMDPSLTRLRQKKDGGIGL